VSDGARHGYGYLLTHGALTVELARGLTFVDKTQGGDQLEVVLDDPAPEYGLPAHTVGLGSKGCVVFSSEPVREYRDYLTKIHHDLTDLAWLYHMNNGVFMTPGQDEEWTLSVFHDDAAIQHYLDVFETFAKEVTDR